MDGFPFMIVTVSASLSKKTQNRKEERKKKRKLFLS